MSKDRQNIMKIEIDNRHSADVLVSELVFNGYIVKEHIVYNDYYPYNISHYVIEFYKQKKNEED